MLCAISNNIEAKEKYMNKKLTPPISSKVLKDVNRIITAAKDKTKVFVDIDGTIVTEYGEPNQQVLSLMNYLAEKNIDIYLWSAGGEENCRKVAKKYNIEKSNVFNNSETYEIELEIKPIKEVLNKYEKTMW